MGWIETATRMAADREQGLVARAGAEAAALGELYDHYQPLVYGFVARRLEDRDAAEEVTTATLARGAAVVRAGQLGETSFGGFLFRVAATAVDDRVRRQARAIPPGVRASDLDQEGDAERAASIADEEALRAFAAAVDRDALRRAVADLEEPSRRVVLLRYFDDLDVDEIAGLLGWSRQTVTIELHRALRAIRGEPQAEAIDAA